MRYLPVLLLAACTASYGDLELDAEPGVVGVGLTASYTVMQHSCLGDCWTEAPSALTATIHSGSAVTVDVVDLALGSFAVTGVAPGSGSVLVTGDGDVSTILTFSVEPVAATTLFVHRPINATDEPLSDVTGAVNVFAGTTFPISQANVSAGNGPLGGNAPLVFDPGTTRASFYPTCDCVATGTAVGRGTITAPLAQLPVTVVDGSAIAEFSFGETGSTLVLPSSYDGTDRLLFPTDSAGDPILGAGPDAIFTVGDPSIVGLGSNGVLHGVLHTISLVPLRPGTTSLDITWGNVHKTYTVVSG